MSPALANALSAVLVAVMFSGCASILTPIGEEHYDCNRKENPSSPYCHSFRGVEEGTAGAMPDSRFDRRLQVSEHDKLQGIAPGAVAGRALPAPPTPHSIQAVVAEIAVPQRAGQAGVPVSSLEGLPVRQGPVIQRVWVKRFADGNDLLVSDTTVYKEIMPTRWSGVVETGSPATPRSEVAGRGYPHRPTEPTVVTATTRAQNTPNAADAASAGGKGTSRNAFVQPGQPRNERGQELAPVPASESGTTSLPD